MGPGTQSADDDRTTRIVLGWIHGHQEGRHFHGYYDHHCFLPLFIVCVPVGGWILIPKSEDPPWPGARLMMSMQLEEVEAALLVSGKGPDGIGICGHRTLKSYPASASARCGISVFHLFC